MRVALLADTHAPRFWKSCPPAVARRLEGADAILHAGDVCEASVLDELAAFAPVHVVLGNNDGPDVAAWGAPPEQVVILGGVRIAVVHDSGLPAGRGARLRRSFPDADVVVFGHSHIPWDETVDGQRHVNPGSPTDKRRQPHRTMGELVVEDGRVAAVRILELDA